MAEEARTLSAPGTAGGAPEKSSPRRGTDRSGDAEAAVRPTSRFHRYQLLRPLAEGGMGIVFAARLEGSHGLARLVAIKTLRPITSASARTALLAEARLTARLHHPNIVATIDLGEVDDTPYVVMELVDGVPLSRLLSRGASVVAPRLAAWIVMQAALGLHAAHELTGTDGQPLGLVHRDVSPQNVLVSRTGEVKVADFGIAKFAGREESTATGFIKGKFAYMSPEQASSAEIDRRSDVFALGVVLWEALTGQRLFASDTPARTIMRVLEQKPASPDERRPGVGPELSSIVLRCLEKAPEARYASAGDLAAALRQALHKDPAGPVDETDLAAVVTELFGEERDRFLRDLEAATSDGTTQTFPPEAGGLAGLSITSSRAAAPASASWRPGPWLAALVALAIAGAGGGLFARARWGPSTNAPPPPPPTAAAVTERTAPAEPASAPPAALPPIPSGTAQASASAAPPPAAAVTTASAPRRRPATPPKVAPAAPPVRSATPPAPASTGMPFTDLHSP